MKSYYPLFLLAITIVVSSCHVSGKLSPDKKIAQSQLVADFSLLRKILERVHPSLNWYTAPDSMDFYFRHYQSEIKDSMTEEQFQWKVVSPMLNKIHCGHTSVMMSKSLSKWYKKNKLKSFPFHLKIWNDSMVITENMNREDSFFKRGTLILSINGKDAGQFTNVFLDRLSEDGYSHNVNMIRMSANFPLLYRFVYGMSDSFNITYIDSLGIKKETTIQAFDPEKKSGSLIQNKKRMGPKIATKKQGKKQKYRTFSVDSTRQFATMQLNSFTKGRLSSFFRKSFRTMRKGHINNLILDLRFNGGGMVSKSTLLTRYLSNHSFKIADTVYSIRRSLHPYAGHFKAKYLNNLSMILMTFKKSDGRYHLRRYENKFHHSKSLNHFGGNTFLLVNGPTFSASSLVVNTLKGQENVKIIGEETGGGWYGNSGIRIPYIILPHSKLRVRIPLFRVVNYNHLVENKGKGIAPDIYIPTSYEAILKGYDKKMEVVRGMIQTLKKN